MEVCRVLSKNYVTFQNTHKLSLHNRNFGIKYVQKLSFFVEG